MDGTCSPGSRLVSAARFQIFERALFELARASERLAVYAAPVREGVLRAALARLPGLAGPSVTRHRRIEAVREDLEKALQALLQARVELQGGDMAAAINAVLTCERWSATGLTGLLHLDPDHEDPDPKPGPEPAPPPES